MRFFFPVLIQTLSLQGLDDILPGAGCRQEQALVEALKGLRVKNISDVRKCSSGRGCVTWMPSCIENLFGLGILLRTLRADSVFFDSVLILSLFSPFSFLHLQDWL